MVDLSLQNQTSVVVVYYTHMTSLQVLVEVVLQEGVIGLENENVAHATGVSLNPSDLLLHFSWPMTKPVCVTLLNDNMTMSNSKIL